MICNNADTLDRKRVRAHGSMVYEGGAFLGEEGEGPLRGVVGPVFPAKTPLNPLPHILLVIVQHTGRPCVLPAAAHASNFILPGSEL